MPKRLRQAEKQFHIYALIDPRDNMARLKFMSRVRELRVKAALNVSRLSQLSGVSRPTIEKMENDETVRADLASAICNVLSEKLGYEVTIESAEIRVL